MSRRAANVAPNKNGRAALKQRATASRALAPNQNAADTGGTSASSPRRGEGDREAVEGR